MLDLMLAHKLSAILFSPLLGIFLISFIPRKFEEGVRAIAFSVSILTAVLTYYLWSHFNQNGYVFMETVAWIPSLNINYRVGLDGASLLLFALTAILTPLCIAASWNDIKSHRKEFYALILACEIGLLGLFAALDLFLFYVFWEVMLIPMYFLIGIWGSGNRIYAATKFLLYTVVGSVLMLAGLIYFYLASGRSFDMTTLGMNPLAPTVQLWIFLSFAIAFAIKVPIFPFHTWLPDAHTEAPTAGSVLLAGVFLKAGAYGFYRIAMPYFPDAVAYFRPYIFVLAVISIIYGALVSMVQKDLKRLIAYSSVSHLGFVMLGLIALDPEGVQGAVLQMVNHGITTGALFLLFGMLYSRAHTRKIADFGGVANAMPVFAWAFVFTGLSSLGLPGLNNFVGEFLTVVGAFRAQPYLACFSASCVIIAAVYILWSIERVFFGDKKPSLKDMSLRETALIAPLLILMVWLGVYPKTALSKLTASTNNFLAMSRRSVTDVPKTPLNIIIPEIRRARPELVIPEAKSELGYKEATGVYEPWDRKEQGKVPEEEGITGTDATFGTEKIPSGSAGREENSVFPRETPPAEGSSPGGSGTE